MTHASDGYRKCEKCVHYSLMNEFCGCSSSNHFQHKILWEHPACQCFCDRENAARVECACEAKAQKEQP